MYYSGEWTNDGAGQASEIGTRLGKLVRTVRLVRLLRLSKALEKQSKGAGEEFDTSAMRNVEFLQDKGKKGIKNNSVNPINTVGSIKNESAVNNSVYKTNFDKFLGVNKRAEEAPLGGVKIARTGRMSLMIRNETHRNILLRNLIKQVLKGKEEQKRKMRRDSINDNVNINRNRMRKKSHSPKDEEEQSTKSNKISKSPSLNENKLSRNISIDEYKQDPPDPSQRNDEVKPIVENRLQKDKNTDRKRRGDDKIDRFRRQLSKFSNFSLVIPEERTRIYDTEKILGRVSKKTDIILPKKSEAVKIWNERIIKKLIFLVLIMNAVMTFMAADFYTTDVEPWDSNLQDLGDVYMVNKDEEFVHEFIDLLKEDFLEHHYDVVGLEFSDGFYNFRNETEIERLRNIEFKISYFKREGLTIKLTLSSEKMVYYQKGLNLAGVAYIIVVLMLSYHFFTKDSNDLVMNPLYKVVKVLNVLLKQPLNPNINGFYLTSNYEDKLFNENEQEYSKIVAVLCRLCWYLSVSFGSRNVELITNRLIMQKKEIGDHDLRGERFFAYYAYFEITDFFDIVHRDREEIIIFANTIMEIIDRTTDRYRGQVERGAYSNKFVLIWKLVSKNEKDNFIEVNRNSSESASLAITNLLKVLIKLHKLRYSSKSELNDLDILTPKGKALRKDLKDYIRITLDAGKLFQSFIGSSSNFQIIHSGNDLLSTKKLHKLVKVYKCPLIITNKVYNILSETIKTYCRKIDVIKFDNFGKSHLARPLYAMDVSGRKLIIEEEIEIIKTQVKQAVRKADLGITGGNPEGQNLSGLDIGEKFQAQASKFEPENNPLIEEYDKPPTIYEKRIAHCEIKSQILIQLRKGAKNRLFMEDTDIQLILNKKYEFRRNFRSAIDFYLLGAWDAAKEFFEKTLDISPNDGPTLAILKFMKKFRYEKPENWRGYRYL